MPKVVIKLMKKVFPNDKLFHMLPVYILIKVINKFCVFIHLLCVKNGLVPRRPASVLYMFRVVAS
jgi:hypothetical protein